jgi:hypothetical protein
VDGVSTTYTVPDSPADPQAAALELIERFPGEVIGRDDPPREVLAALAALLDHAQVFAGLSWWDAKHVAVAVVVDVMCREDAPGVLLQRADGALDGSDGMRWDDPAAMSSALTVAAQVVAL